MFLHVSQRLRRSGELQCLTQTALLERLGHPLSRSLIKRRDEIVTFVFFLPVLLSFVKEVLQLVSNGLFQMRIDADILCTFRTGNSKAEMLRSSKQVGGILHVAVLKLPLG